MSEVNNVLYVTTRQWNPGDEFILAGARSVVREIGWRPRLESIYNKSPQVVGKLSRFNPFRLKHANYSAGYVDSFLQTAHFDNSFGPTNDISVFDAVVFCGSPGWFGGRLSDIYAKLEAFQGIVLFLGIGSSNRDVNLNGREAGVMRRATIVTCRDEHLATVLRDRYGIDTTWITCPALLAAPFETTPDPTAPVGLVYTAAHTNRGQKVSIEHEALQNDIFHAVINAHPSAEVVCNYYDEVDRAGVLFGRQRVRYLYDAAEYPGMMAQYRYAVSSRVHGCGIASSVGVPNVLLGHDRRALTVAGFGSATSLDRGEILELIRGAEDAAELATQSRALQERKAAVMAEYVGLLAGVKA